MFAPMMQQYRDGRPNDPVNMRLVQHSGNPFSGLTPDELRRRMEYERNNRDQFRQGIMPVPMRAVGETPKLPMLTDMRARPPIGSVRPARSLGGGPSPADLANIRAENAAYQAKIASGELVIDPGQMDQGPPRYVTSDQAIKIQAKLDQARQADLSMTPEERSIRSRSLINAQESAARDFMPVKPSRQYVTSHRQPVLTPQPQPFQPQPASPQFGQVQQQPQFNQQGMQQMMQFMQQMMQMFSMMSGQGGQGGFGGGFNQRPPMFGGGFGGGFMNQGPYGGGFGRGGYQQFQQPQQRPMPNMFGNRGRRQFEMQYGFDGKPRGMGLPTNMRTFM
jgi:hypothetical protein